MTQQELDTIIDRHKHWLKKDCEGWEEMRANLSGKDLTGLNLECANLESANLEYANLKYASLKYASLWYASLEYANLEYAKLESANLECANLKSASLESANLKSANLWYASLKSANLKSANLWYASLEYANLESANLKSANLWSANLKSANLEYANLESANLDNSEKHRLGQILKEPITGYKKTSEGVVITAEIPAGAIVFCINGKKCRTNWAKITDMGGKELLHSKYNRTFEYTPGKEIVIEDFDLMYNVECTSGFHFFRTREEAENY